jgi:glycosyltransferase involved in cell wall biosynthesis
MPGANNIYSLVVPVYKNEGSIPDLLLVLEDLNERLDRRLEVVLVVDGSPDRSAELLHERLPECRFHARLVLLSRNFGSYPAVRAGLAEARGRYFAVMAADLQEPPELILTFFRTLEREPFDVTIGTRESRNDPLLSRWASKLFWATYRRLIQAEMPPGGVDVFACNQEFRDRLLGLDESNSSLVGLLFWLGFRRKLIPYQRRARRHGTSAWTIARRVRYLMDSVFAFSDLPIRLLVFFGILGLLFSTGFSIVVLMARISGLIAVPGYAATVLVISFFAALNSLGLGIIGSYVWRAFENTKGRPQTIVMSRRTFEGEGR